MNGYPHGRLAAVLAATDGAPAEAFAALHGIAEALVGARMFTVLRFDLGKRIATRLYSTHEAVYPTGVDDPLGDTIWERTLIEERRPLVLNDPQAMSTLLPNVPELLALGCGSMLNLPVVVRGKPLAALNLLHDTGRYTPERVAAATDLAPAAAAILMWMQV